jgi:long-chain fatty acid transport protein
MCHQCRLRLSVCCSFTLWLVLMALVEQSYSQTPRIQGQGSAASGMGNAFTAQADDPSALHYNPAGMTQLRGVQLMTGALFVGGSTEYTSPTGVTTVGNRDGSVAWPPPTHFYLIANLKDLGLNALGDMTAGVGVTVPFGSLTQYQSNAPFSQTVVFNTLPLLDIKPTIAYKINDQLSIGLGADIYTFSTLIGEGQLEIKSTSGPNGTGAIREVNGSGTGAGFNVSLMYTPFRNAEGLSLANVGLVYRSQAVVPLKGQFLQNGAVVADTSANLALPQIINVGVALWPIRDQEHEWKLEFDIDYVGWRSFRTTAISLSNGSGIPVVQNWRDSFNAMIGMEYKFLKLERLPEWEVALRAGYTYQQTQMPDQTFNPGIPSANTHIPSFGVGFLCNEQGSFLGLTKCGNLGIGRAKPKAVGIDLSFQMAYYEDRTIANPAGTPGFNPAINGIYKTSIPAGGVTLRFNY